MMQWHKWIGDNKWSRRLHIHLPNGKFIPTLPPEATAYEVANIALLANNGRANIIVKDDFTEVQGINVDTGEKFHYAKLETKPGKQWFILQPDGTYYCDMAFPGGMPIELIVEGMMKEKPEAEFATISNNEFVYTKNGEVFHYKLMDEE